MLIFFPQFCLSELKETLELRPGIALVLWDKVAVSEFVPIPGAALCAAAPAQLGEGRKARDAVQGAPGTFNVFKVLLALPSQAVTFFLSGE